MKLLLFFVILAASLALFWILASAVAKKANASH
jgi:hypothetical protein